jgi:hypothetical protein
MKRLITMAAIAVLVCTSSSSALIRLGVKGGINFADIRISNANDSLKVAYKRTPGVILGASADVAIAPSVGLRTELLYVNRSTKYDVKDARGVVTGSGTLKLNEMTLAPFLELRYPLPGGLMPFLEVGPEIGLRTLLKANQGGQNQTLEQTWKKGNFSVNAGAGIIIPVGPAGDITLDGRYNFGVVNLHSSGPMKLNTNGIQLFLGYNFLKI